MSIAGMTRIKIEVPGPEGGLASVVDADTGKPLSCRALDLRIAVDETPVLILELIDFEAMIEGTWECRKVAERAIDDDDEADG